MTNMSNEGENYAVGINRELLKYLPGVLMATAKKM